MLSSPGDIIETLETEKQIRLAVPVLSYMGQGGTQGDTGGHFMSGAWQTEHALSCLDALGPFQLCDCPDGTGVPVYSPELEEEQIIQPAWGHDGFSNSFFSAAHMLPQGRG